MKLCLFTLLVASSVLLSGSVAEAQLPSGWRAHDLNRPLPKVVDPGENKLPASVPSDAVILFDGTDLSKWTDAQGNSAKWTVDDGVMTSKPGSGYLFTKEKFGDCQLHVEWASPSTPKSSGQGRGNSGVFLMGRYEIQVLDCYENETYADGSAGSLYGQYPPLVNASRKPGQWQSYDIVFHQAIYDDQKLVSPATITVLHNGVLIQDHSAAWGPTDWIQHKSESAGPDKLPLSLQDHGNPVRYRNIWIRPLAARSRPDQPYASEGSNVSISDESKSKLVGKFGEYRVEDRDGSLAFIFAGRPLKMLPVSQTEFEFERSAGNVNFQTDDDGKVISLKLRLDALGAGTKEIDKSSADE